MKKSFIVPLFTVLALALAVNLHAGTPTPKPKKKVHTIIASVDAGSITVQEPDKTVTYKITPLTEITFKGNSATVSDLKPGQRVDVTASDDPTVADRIAADDPPKDK